MDQKRKGWVDVKSEVWRKGLAWVGCQKSRGRRRWKGRREGLRGVKTKVLRGDASDARKVLWSCVPARPL